MKGNHSSQVALPSINKLLQAEALMRFQQKKSGHVPLGQRDFIMMWMIKRGRSPPWELQYRGKCEPCILLPSVWLPLQRKTLGEKRPMTLFRKKLYLAPGLVSRESLQENCFRPLCWYPISHPTSGLSSMGITKFSRDSWIRGYQAALIWKNNEAERVRTCLSVTL